ncbi:hypothetical protein KIN20_030051, partial [Parelaphostrongylus tenuis]
STRTFTASGPSNLPVIAVYTQNNVISTYNLVLQLARVLFGHCATFCNANSRRCSRNRRSESTLT